MTFNLGIVVALILTALIIVFTWFDVRRSRRQLENALKAYYERMEAPHGKNF